MGIRNLTSIINTKYGKYITKHLSYLSGKTIAIDANFYLYKSLYNNGNHIKNLFYMINKLNKFNIKPLFVFDGKPPVEKAKTIEIRREIRENREIKINEIKKQLFSTEVSVEDSLVDKIILEKELKKLESQHVKITWEILDKTKELFNLMGVGYIVGTTEAEMVSVKLCKMKLVDGVMTDDTDTYAAGCNMVLSNLITNTENINVVYLPKLLKKLELDYNSFLDLCILLGNDYIDRPSNINVEECIKKIKDYKSLEEILEKDKDIIINKKCIEIRRLYDVSEIEIDNIEIEKQLNKRANIFELKKFMMTNCNINEDNLNKRIGFIKNTTILTANEIELANKNKELLINEDD